jgi:hypothetical protein
MGSLRAHYDNQKLVPILHRNFHCNWHFGCNCVATGTITGATTGTKELALQLQLCYNEIDRELWIYLPVVRLVLKVVWAHNLLE